MDEEDNLMNFGLFLFNIYNLREMKKVFDFGAILVFLSVFEEMAYNETNYIKEEEESVIVIPDNNFEGFIFGYLIQ